MNVKAPDWSSWESSHCPSSTLLLLIYSKTYFSSPLSLSNPFSLPSLSLPRSLRVYSLSLMSLSLLFWLSLLCHSTLGTRRLAAAMLSWPCGKAPCTDTGPVIPWAWAGWRRRRREHVRVVVRGWQELRATGLLWLRDTIYIPSMHKSEKTPPNPPHLTPFEHQQTTATSLTLQHTSPQPSRFYPLQHKSFCYSQQWWYIYSIFTTEFSCNPFFSFPHAIWMPQLQLLQEWIWLRSEPHLAQIRIRSRISSSFVVTQIAKKAVNSQIAKTVVHSQIVEIPRQPSQRPILR